MAEREQTVNEAKGAWRSTSGSERRDEVELRRRRQSGDEVVVSPGLMVNVTAEGRNHKQSDSEGARATVAGKIYTYVSCFG
jgi:hypothetical protein